VEILKKQSFFHSLTQICVPIIIAEGKRIVIIKAFIHPDYLYVRYKNIKEPINAPYKIKHIRVRTNPAAIKTIK
jgi:hypothetical protein